MKTKTFIGDSRHRGSLGGNLVSYDIYFNCIEFRLYIRHRVAQSTSIKSTLEYSKNEYLNYDRYDFVIDTRRFNYIDDAFKVLTDSIISINKYINLESINSSKISEELLKILG